MDEISFIVYLLFRFILHVHLHCHSNVDKFSLFARCDCYQNEACKRMLKEKPVKKQRRTNDQVTKKNEIFAFSSF